RLIKPGGRLAVKGPIPIAHRPYTFPIAHFFWTLHQAPRYLHSFGPGMMLRILGYRLNWAQLERAFRRQRLTLAELEATYSGILPGVTITTNQQKYLAVWDKLSNGIRGYG